MSFLHAVPPIGTPQVLIQADLGFSLFVFFEPTATVFSLFVFFEPTATTDFSRFAFFIDGDKRLLLRLLHRRRQTSPASSSSNLWRQQASPPRLESNFKRILLRVKKKVAMTRFSVSQEMKMIEEMLGSGGAYHMVPRADKRKEVPSQLKDSLC
ncbi:uncharacterized protein LOC122037255 [Zingiber officinale]|uniref:uncharacterized protein LOC122037255 n=1 Tax=Zingiber officinale TaxID=94328 RepID=UPI001C4D9426|nr:uncharacterized protein LOC122037255 [Zingiber officinale]